MAELHDAHDLYVQDVLSYNEFTVEKRSALKRTLVLCSAPSAAGYTGGTSSDSAAVVSVRVRPMAGYDIELVQNVLHILLQCVIIVRNIVLLGLGWGSRHLDLLNAYMAAPAPAPA